MESLRAVKGHGTENDFVIIDDLDNTLDLTPELVRALCDRRAGIGADGILRVVRTEHEPIVAEHRAIAPYFMDYRNADGSLAQMCGNGVRVFVRYLTREGLADGRLAVATRGGVKQTWLNDDGSISVEMGRPEVLSVGPLVLARNQGGRVQGLALTIPNPHVVVAVATLDQLADLDLTVAPTVEPALPDGQNVEFVTRVGERHLRMRVHERGVGETRSCGTGICAAVVAIATTDGTERDGTLWRVDVPGGTCMVTWRTDNNLVMSGPAVLVADVDLDSTWLRVSSR